MAVNSDGLYERDPQDINKFIFPDKLSFVKEPFATVIPWRSPPFKVHKTEGLANSALSHHGQGAKYKQVDGVWIKVWEFYEPTECENCQNPLSDDDEVSHYFRNRHDRWHRSPLYRGATLFAPFLCKECFNKEQAVVDDRAKARAWRAELKRRQQYDALNSI